MNLESRLTKIYSNIRGEESIPFNSDSNDLADGEASFHDFLAILNILIDGEKKLHSDEDKKVWSVVYEGIQVLVWLKFDYNKQNDCLIHFKHRIRNPRYKGKRGPQLIEGNEFHNMRSHLKRSISPGASSIYSEHMQQFDRLVKILNSKLFFCNYNRSVRFLDLIFTIIIEGKEIKQSTADWIRDDLCMLSARNDEKNFCYDDHLVACSEIESNFNNSFSSADYFLDLYERVSKCNEKFVRVHLNKLKDLKKIEQHPEGAKVRINIFKFIFAWVYVLFVLTASVSVGVLNVAGRENWYERLMDVVQTATLLLVSVFGLLKLTSEDQSVIRHTCLGYKVLRSPEDVMKAWGLETEEDLKIAIALKEDGYEWLDRDGTCYAVGATAGKGIRLSRGIETRTLYRLVGGFDGNRYFHGDKKLGFHIKYMESGATHILAGAQPDMKYLYPNLATVIKSGITE